MTSVFVVGGTTPTGAGKEIRRAKMIVNLIHKSERARTQKQVENELTRRIAGIPDVRGWYVNDRGERELAVTMLGDDPVALNQAVAKLESAMRRLPGFGNVAPSAGADRPEIRVVPKGDQAARFGVTTEAISDAVRIATIGDVSMNLAKFRDGDRLIPIRVQVDTALRADLGGMETMAVQGATGISVPLLSVADVSLGQGPASIERFDRVRRVVLGRTWPAAWRWVPPSSRCSRCRKRPTCPPGCGCRTAATRRSWARCSAASPWRWARGLTIVLGVLILLFRNVFQPITILLSLPLSLGGVILALVLTRRSHQHAGRDRDPDADGDRDQERDHAGGLRDRAAGRGNEPRRGDHRRRAQTGAADRDDDHRHGGRHGAERAGTGGWR